MNSGRHVDMDQHINKKYNYLTVLSLYINFYQYKEKSLKRTFFNCKCECGNLKRIPSGAVINGTTKSCGCKKSELIKETNKLHYEKELLSVEKRMFSNYKKPGLEFKLLLPEFISLVTQNCYYCGGEPLHERFSKKHDQVKLLNGIDRIDSNKGYVLDNCVPCCTTCNYMKNVLSIDDFLSHTQKITNFQKNKT